MVREVLGVPWGDHLRSHEIRHLLQAQLVRAQHHRAQLQVQQLLAEHLVQVQQQARVVQQQAQGWAQELSPQALPQLAQQQ